jgi:hypothetical protein
LEDGEGMDGEGFACPVVGRAVRVEEFDVVLVGRHEFVGGRLGARSVSLSGVAIVLSFPSFHGAHR